VKVPYVEDKATQGGTGAPSETDVGRMIRAEVETWNPRRGPDWSDFMLRLAAAGPAPWVVYTTASAALMVILFGAFLIGSWFQLGGLGLEPAIQSHVR
jgi:hypothetical protein